VIRCRMGEVQITDEATQEECLLDVLLAKVGIRWLETLNTRCAFKKKTGKRVRT
jgi:hypothetical protein